MGNKMDITLNSEVLDIRDDKLEAYFNSTEYNDYCYESWVAFNELIEKAGAYNVDWIDWSTESDHLTLTVHLTQKDKVLKALQEFIDNLN